VARGTPDQASLDRLLEGAERLRVTEVMGGRLLLEIDDPREVAPFAECLRIHPGPPFHCLCPGDQNLEFSRPRRRATKITLHHGRSLRWESRWDSDVLLDDPMRVLDWFADHGAPGPREAYREDQERARQERAAWEAWKRAAPPCVEPLVDELSALGMVPPDVDEPAVFARARALMLDTYTTEEEVILELLAWFGHGEGPWSGFPSYEAMAERLLLTFPTEGIVSAVEAAAPTPARLEGAARLFASWWFQKQRPGEASRIPSELADRLRTHLEGSPYEDNRGRLRASLG